ncbi:MAG: VWA domain-containing protein [Betaproteobacteria bacterium]
MSLKANGFWSAVVGIAVVAGLSAQTSRPASPKAPPAQKPTFRVQVDLVTTDVVVRDGQGQFVPDLKKDEFEVYEDGVKQDISSMTLVHGGRVTNVLAPPPPPPPEGIILPPSKPVNDTSGRIFLFFVDDLHMQFKNTGRIRDLFKRIQKNLLHEGDMWAMVTSGPSSIAIDLTYDRNRFDEAVRKITGSGLKPDEIINGPTGSEGPSEVRYRAHVAFSTAHDFLQNLDKVHNRRKAVVWVSDGYDFNPFENARLGLMDPNSPFAQNQAAQTENQMNQQNNETDPFTQQQKQSEEFSDADLASELAELTREANSANATLYTLDPRGLVGGSDIDENVDPTEWSDYIRKSQDSLRVLADETGGIAVVNQNDFDKALKRIDAETSDYYVLGYYSKNPDATRRRRTIDVKVTRKGLTVFARKEYFLKPTPPPTSPTKQP